MVCTSIQFDLVQHYYGYYGDLIDHMMFLGFLWIFWSPLDLVTLTSEKAFCKDLVLGFVWHVYSGVPWFFFNFCEFFEVCHICVTHHPVTCHSKLIPSKNAVKWCPYCLSCTNKHKQAQTSTNKHKQAQIFNTLIFLDIFLQFIGLLSESYRILVKLGADCKVLLVSVVLWKGVSLNGVNKAAWNTLWIFHCLGNVRRYVTGPKISVMGKGPSRFGASFLLW